MKIRTNSAEKAEVILSNLIQLTSEDVFTIPFVHIKVTLETAIDSLRDAEERKLTVKAFINGRCDRI